MKANAEIRRLRDLINDDLAGCTARLDGNPIPEGASEAFIDAWKSQDELMRLQSMRKKMFKLYKDLNTILESSSYVKHPLGYIKRQIKSIISMQGEINEQETEHRGS